MKIDEFIDRMKYLDDIEDKLSNVEREIKKVRNMYIEYLEAIEYIQNWIYSMEMEKQRKYEIKSKNRYIPIEKSKNFLIFLDKKNKEYVCVKK